MTETLGYEVPGMHRAIVFSERRRRFEATDGRAASEDAVGARAAPFFIVDRGRRSVVGDGRLKRWRK
jgi:hypothetical protein